MRRLAEVRIIVLGSVVADPFAATVLGDYGAEVIRIEPPTVPDAVRYWAATEDRYQPFWLATARNKLPIKLNLKHPQGRRILTQLVAQSDVLLENMRPGTLAEVLEACETAGVTIGPVYGMEEIARDPQYLARGSIVPLFDPASEKTIPFPEAPIRLSATPGKVRFPGLPMGAANEVVLQDLLGYTPGEIASLKSSGAI